MSDSYQVGFAPEEIRTDQSTRSARLKWVVVVDEALPAGRAANAAICVASSTAASVTGLLGPEVKDAGGTVHTALPWTGCVVLGASSDRMTAIRAKALDSLGVFVADMPTNGQKTQVYDEYVQQVELARPEELKYHALSLVGPRNRVDRLVKGLTLLP